MPRSRSILNVMLVVVLFILCSCAQKGIIVTADPERLSNMDGCFDFLGAPVESGGPIVKRLCSRDIGKVVSLSHLTREKGKRLQELICGPKGNPVDFKNFFQSLAPSEKNRLIRSFELYGYEINGYGC